ncbi:MAG: FAD-binding oxidoreductase [Alphaproteobacteria bacterium]|nr:FAD-binding oxidoreductase [Alphaproteobacteria bacterium]
MTARRKFWGWGREDQTVSDEEAVFLARVFGQRFGSNLVLRPAPKESEFDLRASRLLPPSVLSRICTSAPHERLVHAYGKSFPDYVRMFQRQVPCPPDVVAYPESESDVFAVLDWAARENAAVIPFGAGSSVCGGVECDVGDGYAGVISLDMTRMGKVEEIDKTSRAARIQAGALGPDLEAQLKPHGLTLRHFPQSFEFSTLGGWIATRSGGHYATLYTHIDDFVQALRVVTPAGLMQTRRLPGSGAGPQPERLFVGSEGILGVITEAWVRLQDTPKFRASASVKFTDFLKGAEAVRALAQSGLNPSNCRLIDAQEALGTGAGDGSASLLVLAFESADHAQDTKLARALELVRDHGGVVDAPPTMSEGQHREGAAGAWRNAFLRAPFYREVLVPMGVIVDTFETAVTWDRFPAFHAEVTRRIGDILKRVTGKPGMVTCRFTHAYPDGPAPYYTFQALGRMTALLEQWQEIKAVANDVVVAAGGTITHHHAVGRDHRPGYTRECPPLFAEALRAAKASVDPNGLMNPGVLIDPAGRKVGVRGAMAGV